METSLKYEVFTFELAAELIGQRGAGIDIDDSLSSLNTRDSSAKRLSRDENRAFDLSLELARGEDAFLYARLDRAALRWSSEQAVVKLGRQAISWGNGLAFQVVDIFNPFSPLEIDKDYKPGSDMLYAQFLGKNGGDLQLLAVARRGFESESIEEEYSSFAAKWQDSLPFAPFQYHILLAEHFQDQVYGASVIGDLWDGILRTDVSITDYSHFSSSRSAVSFLVNYDRSWTVAGRNLYTFLEFYRNGFGSAHLLSTLPPEVDQRFQRGELFTLGRDYVACGGQLEIHPLLLGSLTSILSLNDFSGLLQPILEYEAAQNLSILFGSTVSFGEPGSEFGGLLFADSSLRLSVPDRLFLRVEYYY